MRTGRRGSGRDDQCDGRGWGQDEVVEAQIRAFRERGKDHGESSSPVREEVSNGSNPIPSLYSTAASTLRKNQNQLQKLPPNNQLWGFVINAGAVGLIYLLLGVWTRSAAASFQQIVRTRGSDITNLMNGMGS